MSKVTVALGLIFLVGGLGGTANAHTRLTSSVVKTADINRLVRGEMAARGIPGLQLVIIRDRKILLSRSYGQASVEDQKPVTAQTIFPINSISKAFTGVAAMQLVEAGYLDLDTPIGTYLKEGPSSWAPITVRQVLTHTSGLPEIVDDNIRLIDGAQPEIAWEKVSALPLSAVPGTQFSYSQTNYVVMGKIVKKLTGKSFSSFLRAGQFDLADMGRTTAGAPANARRDIATTYSYLSLLTNGTKTIGVERSKVLRRRQEAWPEFLLPAGGVQSTATDLAKWIIALQSLKLVNKDSLGHLWTPQLLKDGTYGGFSKDMNGYALGWPVSRRATHPVLTPKGGERAAMFVYPRDDLTVIVLTNLMGASPQKFIHKIAELYVPDLTVADR